MSDYRTKTGPIPDEAFENDCGAPDPERTAKRSGEKFRSKLNEMLAANMAEAKRLSQEEK